MEWLIGALAIGAGVLAVGMFADYRASRKVDPQPETDSTLELATPTYISQDQVDRVHVPGYTGEAAGNSYPVSAATLWAEKVRLDEPKVVVVSGEITSQRELYPIYALPGAIVVLSSGISDEVAAVCVANAKLPGRQLLVAITDETTRAELAKVTGAIVMEPADLRAGFVPEQWLGQAKAVTAAPRQLTVLV